MAKGSLAHLGTVGDGPKMPNKRCSNCMARDAECTYVLGYVRRSINLINQIILSCLTALQNSGYPRRSVL